MVDWVSMLIGLVINVIILSPVLWLSGRMLVGGQKAKFTDAVMIVVVGVVIGTIVGWLLAGWAGWLSTIIMLIVWLGLIKHYFDCGWLKALLVAIVTIIIFAIIAVVLALIGIGIFSIVI